ncbi:MAG: O-antigen ligase family protein [Patescibacteria group bacterium]|nr:O-antigen ligase family protein [Patescibacteria group bacterium]
MFLKLSKFFLYLSLFSVLIVSPTLYFPYIVGKAVFFRLAIELAILFLAIWWAWEADNRRVKPAAEEGGKKVGWLRRLASEQPLTLAVSAFGIAAVLACVFGINPWFSFWSNFERGEGGFQILNYISLFFLAIALFKSEAEWSRVFKVMISISLAVVAYGLLAAFNVPGIIGPQGLLSRLSGTLGNADYAGTFMIFSLFYSLYLLTKEKERWVKWLLWLTIPVFLVFMLLTQTRGAIVGLMAGVFAFLVYGAFKMPKGRAKKWFIGLVVASLVLGGGFLAAQKYLDKINNCSICDRYLHISVSAETFQTRFWAWGEAVDAWKARPVFGWGPEEFSAAFDKYFNTNYFDPNSASNQTWFDRAHSIYFDYLAETGAIGLLAYMSIFAVFFWQFFSKTKKKALPAGEHQPHHRRLSVIQEGLILGIPVAYLVQGIVLFDVLPTYISVMLFLAFANFELKRYGQRS